MINNTSKIKYFLTISLAIWYLLFCTGQSYAQNEDTTFDPFTEAGFNPYREFASDIFTEHFDPFSGTVTLTYTDLYLPGNGGQDIKIQRTYNSGNIWNRRDLFMYNKAHYDFEPTGLGWSIHMGKLINPYGNGSSNARFPDNPVVIMPDGSSHVLYKKDATYFITKEFWLYKRVGTEDKWELTLTDGTVYTFEYNTTTTFSGYAIGPMNGTQLVAQVIKIKDTNGNIITVNYGRDSNPSRSYITSIVQSFENNTIRTIAFNYDAVNKVYSSITANGRTVVTYNYITAYNGDLYDKLLTKVQPAPGNSWEYSYYSTSTEDRFLVLRDATFPTGGKITYDYAGVNFCVGKNGLTLVDVEFLAVTQKNTSGSGSGRDITPGTWSYSYDYSGHTAENKTTITYPGTGGKKETYTHWGWNDVSNGSVWKVGLLKEKTIENTTGTLQTETYTWEQGGSISNDKLGNAGWMQSGGNSFAGAVYDNYIYIPRLQSKSINRGGSPYTTTYSDYDSYAQPGTISETGQISRTTELTYWYYTYNDKNIVKGKVLSERVTADSGETFIKGYTYEDNTGNMKSQNIYGVITTYQYHPDGNLSQVNDARGSITSYSDYDYGKAKTINHPGYYTITRTVDWWGNITSVTNGMGYRTDYTYDNLNRLITVNPPGTLESNTTITYQADLSYKTVSKGYYVVYWIRYYYDGFGRFTGTDDVAGVLTDIDYNARGEKVYVSYPYIGTRKGESLSYDDLGRVMLISKPLSASVSYGYSGNNVTITNERGNRTTYYYQSFGDPEEKRLNRVHHDSLGDTYDTYYSYNTPGSLTAIDAPGTKGDRNFVYNTKNFMTSETHHEIGPINQETGTITYGYDAIGNVTSKTDSKGKTSFTYDDLNRLTSMNYPDAAYNVTLGYDNADNLVQLTNSSSNDSFTYNESNWLTRKTAVVEGMTYYTDYDYDGRGNITEITYPRGRVVSYINNSANQVTSISGFVDNVQYHPSGKVKYMQYPNGKTSQYYFDDRSRINGIAGSGNPVSLAYGYDSGNNVTSIAGTISGNSFNCSGFNYDALDRLTNINGPWGTAQYGYDTLANITSKNIAGQQTTFNYNTKNQLLSTTGAEAATFTYDGNGNMTGDGVNTFAFNPPNQLISANAQIGYGYDGHGVRVSKNNNGDITVYHHDQEGNIIAETKNNGYTRANYIYLKGLLIAKITPSITVTSPDPGEDWPINSIRTIQWTSSGDIGGTVSIEVGRPGGCSDYVWTTLTSSTPNDGSYSWTVGGDPADNSVIKICGGAVCGQSEPFNIIN